jgi:diadenosine tetraphosphate (Ap4A) HIT family hydrolase
MTDCYVCHHNALLPESLPPRERIHDDSLWRVAHAFDSALPGWLVVVSRRHVTSMSELTAEEAARLGPLLSALSRALESFFPARKAYVIFLAEGEGFEHLHIHVVPRREDIPDDRKGPRVFGYLGAAEPVGPEEMDRISVELRPMVERELRSFYREES